MSTGLDGVGGIIQDRSLDKARFEPEDHPLLQNHGSPSSQPLPQTSSSRDGDDDPLRRVRVEAMVAQWNAGFFEPRGLEVTVQFTSVRTPTEGRVRGNVLQKTPPPPTLVDTQLHLAVSKGSKSKVLEALKQGDHLEALNRKGESALYRAVIKGEKSIVQILLDRGAIPSARPSGQYSALQYAASRGEKSILKLLAEKSTLEEIEEVTPAGETALYLAVQKHENGCVEVLLKCRADVNARPLGQDSMLNIAVSASQTGIVKMLLANGAFVEERVRLISFRNFYPFKAFISHLKD
jgi:hypothetical protein